MCKNAILHKKSAILSSVSRRKSDLCVLGWIAKNMVHAWHHNRVGVVCVCVCVCLAYTSEDFHMKTPRHTEDSTPSEDPKTGPLKTLAKNAENVMFYHLRGVRAPRTSMDFKPYLIYEDIRVLGSISKASRCVCVWVHVCFDVGLGGRGLGWVCCFSCVVCGLGLGFVWKMPCELRHHFLL